MNRRDRLAEARLYLVLDGTTSAELLDAALRGGVDIVQLRDKDLLDGELVAAAAPFRAACNRHGALFILNDKPELVEACDADGVHVGQSDMPVADARAAVGNDRLVGLSIETVEQLDAIDGADYLGVGAVYDTPTKADATGAGLELVRAAADRLRIPWFAIGGVDLATAGEVIAAGAPGIAVVRAIRDADDPEEVARTLKRLFA